MVKLQQNTRESNKIISGRQRGRAVDKLELKASQNTIKKRLVAWLDLRQSPIEQEEEEKVDKTATIQSLR